MATINESRPLLSGTELSDFVEKLRSKLDSDKARLLAKGRKLNVRLSDYIDAQRGDDVKDAIRWIVGNKAWKYVSFAEFIECLEKVVDRLHAELYSKGDANVCFVVDSYNKSSFWVIMMSLMLRKFSNVSMAIDDIGVVHRRSMKYKFADDEDSLTKAFRTLPDDTRLVMMDDATYSGEQLYYFHDVVVSQWRASRGHPHMSREGRDGLMNSRDGLMNSRKGGQGGRSHPNASVVIALPFMSRPSTKLFKRRGTTMIVGDTFPGLFDKRSVVQVVTEDVYLEINRSRRESPLEKYVASKGVSISYVSLFFDVLGLLPTNTMFVFEHKIGDSLSIPNRWLKVGQCVPPDVVVAYRAKKDRVAEMVDMIRKDLVIEGLLLDKAVKKPGPWTPSYRLMILATARIQELLSTSPKFRKEFFDRVDLPPQVDGHKQVAFLPLISPEFCDAPYRRYVRMHRVDRGRLGLVLPNEGDDMPPCRLPPYKRTSFRMRIADATAT